MTSTPSNNDGSTAARCAQELCEKFRAILADPVEFRGELTLRISDPERIAEICAYARQKLGFDFLVDITSIDNYGEDPRYTIVYHLYGLSHNQYLRLKTDVSEEKSELPTVVPVWKSANWHEREIYDMMGVRFRGHPDLRRVIMWEGYPHHPLRKDFPLAGKPTDLPDIAFSDAAPLAGGPFVTIAGASDAGAREPRSRLPETDPKEGGPNG